MATIRPDSYIYKIDSSTESVEAQLTSLLIKLFSSISPSSVNQPPQIFDNYINYFKRILSSRFNLVQSTEPQIINMLFDLADKITNNNINKIEQLQNWYSLLTKKKFPSNRWSALYLLLGLSNNNPNNKAQFNTSNLLDKMALLTANNNNWEMMNEISMGNNDISGNIRQQSEMKKAKTPSPIVVNVSKTSKIITEKEWINDLMFVFQGIDGHFITFNANTNSYALNNIIPFNENIFDIVNTLVELGWLYKKVSNYLNFFNESNIPSQFIQSFSYAVQNELNEYYKLISFFKKKNTNSSTAESTEDLSLKNLILWTLEPIERMKWLAISCESVYMLRGTAIISQIYSYVHYSGGEIYLSKILEEITKPFCSFVKNWIQYGELQDPFKEFFVDILDKINDDDIWSLKYQLIYKNIPNFWNRDLAVKIFEIGKCVNFIRKYCGEIGYSLSHWKEIILKIVAEEEKVVRENDNKMDIDVNSEAVGGKEKEKQNNKFIDIKSYKSCLQFIIELEDNSAASNTSSSQGIKGKLEAEASSERKATPISFTSVSFLTWLISQVDLIHSLVNKSLIDWWYTKFYFRENLDSINRYLLLGQGDMMQSLMESLFDELKKPASHIYKHNLQANLETAIRASNAQYNDPECLKRLNIKLMDASTGDTGWDIFVLEYNIDTPLTVIFNHSLLKEYQKLFFFFWKLKRWEYSQDHQIWRKFMTYSHTLKGNYDSTRKVIHRSMLFNQQVIHFVSNLHNFIALEVLETQYKTIIDALPGMKSLDELISTHKKFVENVISQSLLNTENNSIYKKIMQIFDWIIQFRTALDVLTTSILEEHFEHLNNDVSLNDEFTGMQMNRNFSNEAANQITTLFDKFKWHISEWMNSIEYFGKGNMKYLKMKLDYNEYYSKLEKDNDLREQQDIIDRIDRDEEEKKRLENANDDDDDQDFKEDPVDDEEFYGNIDYNQPGEDNEDYVDDNIEMNNNNNNNNNNSIDNMSSRNRMSGRNDQEDNDNLNNFSSNNINTEKKTYEIHHDSGSENLNDSGDEIKFNNKRNNHGRNDQDNDGDDDEI